MRGALALPREGPARLALLALGALILTTAATIPLADARAPAVRETLKAVEYALVFVVAWCAARGERDAPRLLGAACGATLVLVALDALRDYARPESALRLGTQTIVRIAGHLEGPNQLAAWIGLALPAAVAGIESAVALGAIVAIAGATLALTISRGGAAQTIVAFAGALFARAAPRGERAALAAAFALAFALALGGLAAELRSAGALFHTSDDLGGTGSRAILWPAAVAMARAHPLLGVGAGNFELELPRYGAPPRVRTHANSLYLEAAADGGIVLLLGTLAAALIPPLALLRARGAPLALAAAIAGLALAAHGLIDDVTFYTKVGQLWWLIAGVAAASAGASRSAPSTVPGTRYART